MGAPPCVQSSSSSSRSSSDSNSHITAAPAMTDDQRDSCYYPGCRKDANCNCEICLASINATLDLMPFSVHKSSLTKLSASRPGRTPVMFDPSILSTPTSTAVSLRKVDSPSVKSTGKASVLGKTEKNEKRRDWGFRAKFFWWIVLFGLIFAADLGISRWLSEAFRPVISFDLVRKAGEKSRVEANLNGKVRLLQRELQLLVAGKVSNCSDLTSLWKISQDGLLSSSSCTLYKSGVEEVKIWGWPLQNAGLLASGSSSRSFTILSGRVTLWSEGTIGYKIIKANSSWVQRKWSASIVQLDPRTLVLEYSRSFVLDKAGFFSNVLEILKHNLSGTVKTIGQKYWYFTTFGSKFRKIKKNDSVRVPT